MTRKLLSAASMIALGVLLFGCSGASSPETNEHESSEVETVEGDNTDSASEDAGSGDTSDKPTAIEMVHLLLDGKYTEDEIKAVTNETLTFAGQPISNSNQEALWDSVLSVKRGLLEKGYPEPDSLEVVHCVPSGMTRYQVSMVDAVAYCSLETAGIPESEW